MSRRIVLAVAVLVVILAGGAAYAGSQSGNEAKPAVAQPPTVPVARRDVTQSVIAPGELQGSKQAFVSPGVSGQLAAIRVQAGDAVQAGDVVAELDRKPLEEALATARNKLALARLDHERKVEEAKAAVQRAELDLEKAQTRTSNTASATAAVAQAEAALQNLLAGPDESELTLAQVEVANAEAALKQAQAAYDKVAWMPDVGARPEALKLEQATNAYLAAKARLDKTLAPPSDAEVASARANLNKAKADLEKAQADEALAPQELAALADALARARADLKRTEDGFDRQLEEDVKAAESDLAATQITAPFSGLVVEVTAGVGDAVSAGKGFLTLVDPTAVEVRATVVEEDFPLVTVGQEVEVYFDAVPEAEVRGRVSRIVPQRTSGERPVYPVYISLDEVPTSVAPGMTVDTAIVVAQKKGVLALPRAVVRAGAGGTTQVEVWADGKAEKRTVKTGLRGNDYVEILDGLQEGELVVGR